MRSPNSRLYLLAALIASAAMLSGCEDGTTQFGNSTASAEENTEENSEGNSEENSSLPPEVPPQMGTGEVDYNNFADEPFTLDRDSITWLYANNPTGDAFDIWLMTEAERSQYSSAIAALPASADPSNQAYQASYGIDLVPAYTNGQPENHDLSAGKYYVVIDNTELGTYRTVPAGPITYEFGVVANNVRLAASDESPLE